VPELGLGKERTLFSYLNWAIPVSKKPYLR